MKSSHQLRPFSLIRVGLSEHYVRQYDTAALYRIADRPVIVGRSHSSPWKNTNIRAAAEHKSQDERFHMTMLRSYFKALPIRFMSVFVGLSLA
jgi:hypothetical protein